jgi:hypothetical protein
MYINNSIIIVKVAIEKEQLSILVTIFFFFLYYPQYILSFTLYLHLNNILCERKSVKEIKRKKKKEREKIIIIIIIIKFYYSD